MTLTLNARQFEADGLGTETEVPLRTWFDISLFARVQDPLADQLPQYLEKQLLRSSTQTITLDVPEKPAYVSVDPFRKLSDRWPENNGRVVESR